MRNPGRYAALLLPPRSPYSFVKNAFKRARERQEARELQRQVLRRQLALNSYRQKGEDFLVLAEAVVPRVRDLNGDYRHEKDFSVKPKADGTFARPIRCRPKRWQGTLNRIGEDEMLDLPWEAPEPDIIRV